MEDKESSYQSSLDKSKSEISSKKSESNGSKQITKSSKSSNLDNVIDFQTRRKDLEEAEKRFDEILQEEIQNGKESQNSFSNNESFDSLEFPKVVEKNKNNIEELKLKLKQFKKEEEIGTDVLNGYEKIINNKNGCFDDNIFEEKCLELLKKNYCLREYDAFPIFNRIKSLKRAAKITQIEYVEITLNITNSDTKMYNFLKNNESELALNYDNEKLNLHLFILIEKEMEKNHNKYFANFYFFNHHCLIKKELIKADKNYFTFGATLLQNEVSDEYFTLTKKLDNMNCDILNIPQENEKKKNLIKLKNEMIQKMKKISKQESKIFITLKMEFKSQELDGFLSTTKDTVITHGNLTIGIPKNSFIIVECKNNLKVDSIIHNIKSKMKKLKLLGINIQKLYFIGVLYDTNEKNENILKNKQGDLLKNHIFITTSKSLLVKGESVYEHELSVDVNKNFEKLMKMMNDMDERIKNIENIVKNINN